MFAPLELFCCYARKDREMLQQLISHLAVLERRGLLRVWSDVDLDAGAEWEREVHRHLESADIILLLISADFINSDYCYSQEMERALQRHREESAHIIPILLRSTFWEGTPFAGLKMLPEDQVPIARWTHPDDAYQEITSQINLLIPTLRLKRTLAEAERLDTLARWSEALKYYEQALQLAPSNGQALFGKALSYYWSGQDVRSLEAFLEAKQKAPASETGQAAYILAKLLEERGRYDESLQALERASQFLPDDASMHMARARILLKQQDYESALSALEQASQLDLKNVAYHVQAGELLFQMHRFEESLKKYRLAAWFEPENASHYERQGSIQLALKNDEEALAAFQKALALRFAEQRTRHHDQIDLQSAISEEIYNQLGQISLRLARYQEALTIYEQALQSGENKSATLYAGKGKALLHLQDYEAAITSYQTAIKLSTPEVDPEYYHDLGTLYEELAQSAYKLERERRAVLEPEPEEEVVASHLFDPKKLSLLTTLSDNSSEILGIAFHPNGQILASSTMNGLLSLWDMETGEAYYKTTICDGYIWRVAFSPDGDILAIASNNGTISLMDGREGKNNLTMLSGHTQMVYSFAFSSDSRTLFSCSRDKTIKLWDLTTHQEIATLSGHTHYVYGLALSPDGQMLASCSLDKKIILWDLARRSQLSILTGHADWVWDLAFSSDGKLLASSSSDKTIMLWNPASGKKLRTIPSAQEAVWGLTFVPDSEILVSAGNDGSIRFWNTTTGKALRTLNKRTQGHSKCVYDLTFSSDGQILASCSVDGTIKLWGMKD